MDVMGAAVWGWGIFAAIITLLLILDLGLLYPSRQEVGFYKSLKLSAWYCIIALAFGSGVFYYLGSLAALHYFTGYLLEKSLSIDNVFVIFSIFSYFNIPSQYQHRVLFFGVLGAIVLRAAMISLGVSLIEHFAWMLNVFGIFLMVAGLKFLLSEKEEGHIAHNKWFVWLKRHVPFTEKIENERFIYKKCITPLGLALLVIEGMDLVFAVDSIPAILAITTDPFIVYTSNIFAILGLRALYFSVVALVHRFDYLTTAVAWILIFIGSKVFLEQWIHISALVSLLVVLAFILSGIGYSLYKTKLP